MTFRPVEVWRTGQLGVFAEFVSPGVLADWVSSGVFAELVSPGVLAEFVVPGVLADVVSPGVFAELVSPGVLAEDVSPGVLVLATSPGVSAEAAAGAAFVVPGVVAVGVAGVWSFRVGAAYAAVPRPMVEMAATDPTTAHLRVADMVIPFISGASSSG